MNILQVRDLKAFLAAEADRSPVLLDVREDWEVAQAPLNVPGTVTLHIPMNQIPARRAELESAQPVVCFCHHGMRSAQVVAFLMHHGHADVYNLAGGTDAWSLQVDPSVARY
jgi:rhodanese-related sulfurtransferase